MTQKPVLSAAVEGIIDEAVLRRLVSDAGGDLQVVYVMHGKAALRRAIDGYNNAARFSPWVVLVDLDNDAGCAPPLVDAWLPGASRLMKFRVAVRAVEAWLLADRSNIASSLRIPVSRVPLDPDGLPDPKRTLVDMARHSRSPAVREDMVPRPGSGRQVGPAFTVRLVEYIESKWDPASAVSCSDSLRRCVQRIAELVSVG